METLPLVVDLLDTIRGYLCIKILSWFLWNSHVPLADRVERCVILTLTRGTDSLTRDRWGEVFVAGLLLEG